jgi:hypothetical protein
MWYDPGQMSLLDDLLRTLRAPLDFIRGKTGAVRGVEGRIQGDIGRLRNLPAEFKGELEYNKQLVRDYGQRGKNLKGMAAQRFGKGGAGGDAQGQDAGQQQQQMPMPQGGKKKMGLFSKKKRCPGCGEKLDARWELCPYCGFGAPDGGGGGGGGGGGAQGGGHPRTQALDAVGGHGNNNNNNNNYGGGGGGGKPRTMALDMGAQPSAGAGAARLVAWLIPLDGPQGGQLLELRARAIVGTAPDCDVCVKDSSISGRHAEFSAQGGVFRVADLGSTNGTFVNDKRVQNAELVDGDTLRLGRTPFKFKST